MEFSCMPFTRFLIPDFGNFSFVSLSMECSRTAPLNPDVMVTVIMYLELQR